MVKRLLILALAVAGFLGAAAPSKAQDVLIGLNTQNQIFTFLSTSPGTTSSLVTITGVGGDTIVGIDRRPVNGLVYAVAQGSGGIGRIYTLNTTTGAATLVSTMTQPLIGTSFGVDFNPAVDRLRIISNVEQDLRVDVTTGATIVDATLAYASGDPNFGRNPNAVGAAYTNNFDGASMTTLRDIDIAVPPNTTTLLSTQTPPNDGVLNTTLTLSTVNTFVTDLNAYDISGQTGTAYVVFTVVGEGFSRLYTIGATGLSAGLRIGSDTNIVGLVNGLAAPVGEPIPEPATMLLLGTGLIAVAAGVRRRRKYSK